MIDSYVSESNNFRIKVKTDFNFDQSNPLIFQYLFRHIVLITNKGDVAAQLLSRKWNIKNAKNDLKFVEGPGVIGKQPYLEPNQLFVYSSFCA